MEYIAKSIETKIYHDRFSKIQTWTKYNITFEDYKQSLKRHLGNAFYTRKANANKKYIKRGINEAKNIDEIKRAFFNTGIDIEFKIR